ncbi:hypothetical protein MTO98_30375 [Mucilaginibacter sp. SMC90]|uniref:hypothetical protein n=1 Tax=Mucilaginibacter sp. SMC90 TaxID=2929803 RepID=UPI001FB444AF|nr:hypothetical protein [Mucilaginibacter sp. SMC90]UOE48709.1 hypothetical protein MTO98_30375 [Mucilaginibacter sp. SMC90]
MNKNPLSIFLDLFEFDQKDIKERFNELTIILNATSYKNLDSGLLTTGLSFWNARDTVHISVSIDDGDPLDFYSGDDAEEFKSSFETKLSIVENEEIKIIVTVSKEVNDGVISIYDINLFFDSLNKLSLEAIIHEFNTYLLKKNHLVFELQNDNFTIKSDTIWFVRSGYSGSPLQIDRPVIFNKAKSACYYNFISKYILIPEDFSLTDTDHKGLGALFNKLSSIISVALIFDITTIQGSEIAYRLNGYKSINAIAQYLAVQEDDSRQYLKIYKWIYESGSFTDKLGLARNIISLQLENPSDLSLKGEPFLSVQSSYKVYEKQNIKQYIEIRNKVSDQLFGFHDRANKIVDGFASGFQKSTLALLSFYISTIILKVIGKDKLENVFTIDAVTLSTTFIICSIGYFFLINWEVNEQRKRFADSYVDLKQRYTDLLDAQDINRILNSDIEHNADLQFIDDKKKWYTYLWFGYLSLFFIVTWLLYFIYKH